MESKASEEGVFIDPQKNHQAMRWVRSDSRGPFRARKRAGAYPVLTAISLQGGIRYIFFGLSRIVFFLQPFPSVYFYFEFGKRLIYFASSFGKRFSDPQKAFNLVPIFGKFSPQLRFDELQGFWVNKVLVPMGSLVFGDWHDIFLPLQKCLVIYPTPCL